MNRPKEKTVKYIVDVKEVICRGFSVEADSVEGAIEKTKELLESGVDSCYDEYSHTLDTDEWGVYEESGQLVERGE